jgi:uncharacterized phage protein (TIGR02220 family)
MIESKLEERGIFIQWSVFRNKETTLSEKVLFLEINNLSMLDKGCIASNSHFADTLGVKKEAISRLISSLEKKGYITTKIVDGTRNHSRIITINKMLSTDNKMLFRGKQNVNTPLTNCLETKENKTINKTINRTSNNKSKQKELCERVISYFNSKTGKNIKAIDSNIKIIQSRLNENEYTFEDFKYVIDIKFAEWVNDIKMSKYIQPSTIFGRKFDQYLNQDINHIQQALESGLISNYQFENGKDINAFFNKADNSIKGLDYVK